MIEDAAKLRSAVVPWLRSHGAAASARRLDDYGPAASL